MTALKIIPITDILPRQIWTTRYGEFDDNLKKGLYVVSMAGSDPDENVYGNCFNPDSGLEISREEYKSVDFQDDPFPFYKLVGFLNKTHEIKDGKLVEIERPEFQVGDVVCDNDKLAIVVDFGLHDKVPLLFDGRRVYGDIYYKSLTRIGVINVTHKLTTVRD
jgi:hypothetical protein